MKSDYFGRKRLRLEGYNYSNEGAYFITICTKNQVRYFGEIRNGIMGLNELGCVAAKFLQEIPSHYSNVFLDEWVVMPDHIHAIIIIGESAFNPVLASPFATPAPVVRAEQFSARTTGAAPPYSHYGLASKVIKSFKEACTKVIHQNYNDEFAWHRSFYDHIIRNEKALNNIRRYIQKNPLNWHLKKNQST